MKSIKKTALISILSLFIIGGCSESPISSYSLSNLSERSSDLPFDDISISSEPESPYIDYLGTEALTKTDGYILYYGNYGQNTADRLVKQEFVSQSSLTSRLTERIASDLSPDLCEKPENVYYMITKNLFEDLTPYIDTDAPQWQEYSEYLDTHKFKNGNYFYPTSIKQSPYFLAYYSNRIKSYQNGGKTPTELWREGNWDYTAFTDVVKFGASRIYVKYDSAADFSLSNFKKIPMENLLISLGSPFIDTANARYFSNLNNDEFLAEFSFIGNSIAAAVYLPDDLNSYNFTSLNDDQLALIRSSGYSSDELTIVPYPVAADGRYYGITKGYLVPKRAQNIKAAASFINSSRIAARLDEFPDSFTDTDREILTELRSQSYANMVESYGSYVDADTQTEVDKLWRYESFDDIGKEEFNLYEQPLSKALTEFNQNIN